MVLHVLRHENKRATQMTISEWSDEREADGVTVAQIVLPDDLSYDEVPDETIFFEETNPCGRLRTPVPQQGPRQRSRNPFLGDAVAVVYKRERSRGEDSQVAHRMRKKRYESKIRNPMGSVSARESHDGRGDALGRVQERQGSIDRIDNVR